MTSRRENPLHGSLFTPVREKETFCLAELSLTLMLSQNVEITQNFRLYSHNSELVSRYFEVVSQIFDLSMAIVFQLNKQASIGHI